MVFDLPFEILALFLIMSVVLMALSFRGRDLPFTPFFATIAGILWITVFALADNIIMGYTAERDILTNSIFIAGEDASSFEVTHMNVTNTGFQTGIFSTGNNFAGEELSASSSLIGDVVDEMCIYLDKQGSPSGTITIGVWIANTAQTGVNALHVFDTKDITTVTTTSTEYCFTGSGSDDDYTLSSGEAVGVHYSGGDGTNRLFVDIDDTNSFDGTNSYLTLVDPPSSFSDNTTWDLKMSLINNVEIEATDSMDINSYDTKGNTPISYSLGDETNANWYIRVYFSLIGLAFIALSIMQFKVNKQ